tara:strand:- start:67458 stop:67637 length:180 start_codon:yes stop_codon:yes gene_type:complete
VASDISATIIRNMEMPRQLKKVIKNELIVASLYILIKKGVRKTIKATSFKTLAPMDIAG